MQKLCWAAVFLCAFTIYGFGAEKKTITVSAGKLERQNTIVRIAPGASGTASLAGYNGLRDTNGKVCPLQVDADGQGWFVLEHLQAGEKAKYELVQMPQAREGVSLRQEDAKVKLGMAGKTVLEYQTTPSAFPRPGIDPVYQRGAYLHPVTTLSGKVVTDHYPPNHLHQDGIFMSWTKTEFQGRAPDFWNLKDQKGKVEFVGLGRTWNGAVQAGLEAKHRFIDLSGGKPVEALLEDWQVIVYAKCSDHYWIFDLVSTQRCAGKDALKLPQYHYGGFGYRGNWAWNGAGACNVLTSEGETDRVKGNASLARWCDIWGELDGGVAGIAILGHPGNFRAPQPLRIHPSEPYISFAPQQSGAFQIEPGKPYVSRFRFVVHDGKPDKAELDRLWNDYAAPVFADGP